MKRLNIHRKVKQLFWLIQDEEKAGNFYDLQKSAIKGLSTNESFDIVVQYREIEADNALSNLTNKATPIEDIGYRKWKHETAMSFLDRVEIMKS